MKNKNSKTFETEVKKALRKIVKLSVDTNFRKYESILKNEKAIKAKIIERIKKENGLGLTLSFTFDEFFVEIQEVLFSDDGYYTFYFEMPTLTKLGIQFFKEFNAKEALEKYNFKINPAYLLNFTHLLFYVLEKKQSKNEKHIAFKLFKK